MKRPNEMMNGKINELEPKRAWEDESESERSLASRDGRQNHRSYSKNTFLPPVCKASRDLTLVREQSEAEILTNQSGVDLPPMVLKTQQNEREMHSPLPPLRKGSSQFPKLSPWYNLAR